MAGLTSVLLDRVVMRSHANGSLARPKVCPPAGWAGATHIGRDETRRRPEGLKKGRLRRRDINRQPRLGRAKAVSGKTPIAATDLTALAIGLLDHRRRFPERHPARVVDRWDRRQGLATSTGTGRWRIDRLRRRTRDHLIEWVQQRLVAWSDGLT